MNNLSERTVKELMPDGPTWEGKENGLMSKQLSGLSVQMDKDRINGQQIIKDFFPDTTTQLKEWEYVFRLPTGTTLSVAQRKARLKASWNKISPAAYDNTNKIYELSGLNVIARPLEETEDPTTIDYDMIFANGRTGIFLKNYITICGITRCGNIQESSRCGSFNGGRELPIPIVITGDTDFWPLMYVLEAPGGGKAQIPIELQSVFEFLTYKNKPLFMWGIAKVEYV